MKKVHSRRTTVGTISEDVLAYTAGRDIELDSNLVEEDCIGSAAHAVMLSRMKVRPSVLSKAELVRVRKELSSIIKMNRNGKFRITIEDQDVHLAVERHLTARLGDIGKRIHTARSRNDQVALDLRLYSRRQLLMTVREASDLAGILVNLGARNAAVPMVGRTHMQPAMPSSVGLWATAFAESLLEDITCLMLAYELNDQCPLGSAAGYGVPLPIDRQLVSDLLGFSSPIHNVLHASNTRGKMESIILDALGQVMLSLSRLAQDLIVFSMPEFGYFSLPREFCTGSSIMPQKNNPDVLEIMRAKASVVLAQGALVKNILEKSLSGYNRDIQETKAPLMDGFAIVRSSLRIMAGLLKGTTVHADVLAKAFSPGVFATDEAIRLVGQGMPFRDAYHHVKEHLDELKGSDPVRAIAAKKHLGATAGLDFEAYAARISAACAFVSDEKTSCEKAISALLGSKWCL